jgi:hypothetical protein
VRRRRAKIEVGPEAMVTSTKKSCNSSNRSPSEVSVFNKPTPAYDTILSEAHFRSRSSLKTASEILE